MERKPQKSPAIKAFIQMENRNNERDRRRFARAIVKWPKYPHNRRGVVFCWLWDNYDGVREVMSDHDLTWIGVAWLANMDELKGRWGKPVTPNALRRVFARVAPEVEAFRIKEQEAGIVREEQERRAQSVREWKERALRR